MQKGHVWLFVGLVAQDEQFLDKSNWDFLLPVTHHIGIFVMRIESFIIYQLDLS